jgi:hypothetical protein
VGGGGGASHPPPPPPATDIHGRTQPRIARFNDSGYFFDAVVEHPVLVP